MSPKAKRDTLDVLADFIQRTLAGSIRALERLRNRQLGKFWLPLAILIYLAAQLSLTFPAFNGSNPIRDDDAYGYLLKASEIRDSCFMQDCPALNDLRQQFTFATNNPEVAAIQNRTYHRVFVVYHPLESAALVALNAMGISLEKAYDILYAAALIFVHAALIYWIFTNWGPADTITTLLLLTPVLFTGTGLHIIKMHTVAVGFALLLWAEIARKTRRVDWILVPLILLMILSHPLGKLLALVSLAMYALAKPWPFTKRVWAIAGLGTLITVTALFAPALIHTPEFDFNPVAFYPGHWDYLGALAESWQSVSQSIQSWANSFGSAVLLGAIAVLGFISRPPQEKKPLLVTLVLLFGLLTISILYVVPWYGAISFGRVWMLFAIFITAAFAAGLNRFLGMIWAKAKDISKSKITKSSKNVDLFSNYESSLLLFIGGIVVLLLFVFTYFPQNIASYTQFAYARPQEGVLLDPHQVSLIHQNSEQSTVLYMDEYALEYYLTYGALENGAIYYPVLRFSPEINDWMQARGDEIGFVVNRSPLFFLPHSQDGGIELIPRSSLEISGLPSGESRELLLVAQGDAVLRIHYGEGNSDVISMSLTAGSAEWVSLPLEALTTKNLFFELRLNSDPVEIRGLRFNKDSQTLWPWDQGISLITTTPEGEQQTLELTSSQISDPLPLNLQVINDRGFLILARVIH